MNHTRRHTRHCDATCQAQPNTHNTYQRAVQHNSEYLSASEATKGLGRTHACQHSLPPHPNTQQSRSPTLAVSSRARHKPTSRHCNDVSGMVRCFVVNEQRCPASLLGTCARAANRCHHMTKAACGFILQKYSTRPLERVPNAHNKVPSRGFRRVCTPTEGLRHLM